MVKSIRKSKTVTSPSRPLTRGQDLFKWTSKHFHWLDNFDKNWQSPLSHFARQPNGFLKASHLSACRLTKLCAISEKVNMFFTLFKTPQESHIVINVFHNTIYEWNNTSIVHVWSMGLAKNMILMLRMDPLLVPWEKPLQHVSTLVRQFLIDFIIITGNASFKPQ